MVEAFPYVSYTYHCILDERQTRLTEDDFFFFQKLPSSRFSSLKMYVTWILLITYTITDRNARLLVSVFAVLSRTLSLSPLALLTVSATVVTPRVRRCLTIYCQSLSY